MVSGGCIFGNLNIIFSGDFLQSPPFHGTPIYSGELIEGLDSIGSRVRRKNEQRGDIIASRILFKNFFSFFELTEVMRQKDDVIFAQVLSRLGKGESSSDDLSFLKKRCYSSDFDAFPLNTIHLAFTNSHVKALNIRMMDIADGLMYGRISIVASLVFSPKLFLSTYAVTGLSFSNLGSNSNPTS